MPRLSSRRANPGARNIPYTISGRRNAMRARAWGLAANSGKNHRQTGTKHGKPAPQSSSVKHSQPRHPPAATLSTSISQHTMKIIFKTNRGFKPLENGQHRLKLEKNIVQVFYEWVICTAGTSHSNFSQLICWFPLFGAFLTARHVFLTLVFSSQKL